MARLTSKQRKAMPASKFAGPNRSFPVNDAGHAKAALLDVNKAKGLTSSDKAKIRGRAHGLLDKIGK